MKKLLFALLFLPALAAAKVPDEDLILDRTMDPVSPYYYSSLMIRYNAGDPTLGDEEYYFLYYGYAYQDGYKPLVTNEALDKVFMLASGLDADNPNRESLEAMLTLGAEALKQDPFSPKLLNLMAFAYENLGNMEQAKAYSDRMNGVLRTILASGDALTEKTPRHILMFDHAFDSMSAEGLSCGDSRIISRSVEFIPLTVQYVVEGKKRKGYYFDYSRIYRNKPEGYTFERARTWQFNNLKPRTYK